MSKTPDTLKIWNSYLESINKHYQSQLYDFCQKNSSTAVDILDNFHPDFVPAFWVGPGWMPLIFDLHQQLIHFDSFYVIYQIKEKFGGLRYYAEPVDQKYSQSFISIIGEAEAKSLSACEICSKFAQTKKTNLIYRTLCDNCVALF